MKFRRYGTMLFLNARVLDTHMRRFYRGAVRIENGVITDCGANLCAKAGEECVDVGGNYLIPGLVDIHSHGAAGEDFMTSSPEKLVEMAKFYAQNGVTTLFPTLMTDTFENITAAVSRVSAAAKMPENPINFAGIHIEGPYLSDKRPGCHPIELLKPPASAETDAWLAEMGEMKMYMTIAPELSGAMDYIRAYVKRGVRFTVGHSDATGAECREALSAGVGCFTHLYNAMRPLHHREPGVVGTALGTDAYAELICDGVHIDPDVVNMTYRIKGVDRLILITDSMCAAGMPDGKYQLGNLNVTVENSTAWFAPGTLAGSTLNLLRGVKNLVEFAGASLADAVICATRNPARNVGLYDRVGSIEKGKVADLVILDGEYNLVSTVSRGNVVYRA